MTAVLGIFVYIIVMLMTRAILYDKESNMIAPRMCSLIALFWPITIPAFLVYCVALLVICAILVLINSIIVFFNMLIYNKEPF